MSYAAYLPILADRYTPCVRTIRFKGLDLRGRVMRMQLRLATDTRGVPLVDLGSVDTAQAQGLALLEVEDNAGLITSVLQIRINETTMEGLPYLGELGDATVLAYDLITTIGGDKRVLMRGTFAIDPGVTGADAAPADRPHGFGYGSQRTAVTGIRTGATLTLGDEHVEITIDGSDLVAPIARRAEDAAASAESDRAAAAVERAGAEAARDQADISRDVATTAQPTYATQAAGEAATAVGALFAVAPGDGTAQMRRRTAGGSDGLYEFQTTKFRSARGGSPRLIPLSQRLGAQAFITEYVVGDGNADDSDAYQAAQENGNVREWIYPEGCSIALTRTVNWLGERTHRFSHNARIVGEVASGPTIAALGYPDLIGSGVQQIIQRGSTSFYLTADADLQAGDDFYLYDAETEEYDVATCRKRIGLTIFTNRPINYTFLKPENVRIYSLRNACRNVSVIGGEIQNLNNAIDSHGLRIRNATEINLDGLTATKTGGIGVIFEIAMRWQAIRVSALQTGAVGLGGRNVKDFRIIDFIGRSPFRDESLTFFKSATNGEVINPDIEQYLIGEAPPGNLGQAGNCILLDERINFVSIMGGRLRGSATYPIFINNNSNGNKVIDVDIQRGNLGGIRVALNSNDNVIRGGRIVDVVDAMDAEVAPAPGLPTAAIQDDPTCSGNVLGDGTQIARIAGGIAVRQRGDRGTVISRGHADLRGATLFVSTEDWSEGAAGTRMVARPAAKTGNTYVRIYGEQAGGNDFAPVAIAAKSSAPNLTGDGDVVFVVAPNTKLYAAWRDFTGVARMSAAPLGAQLPAQADSAAANVEGLRADLNAHFANLRAAGLMAPQS